MFKHINKEEFVDAMFECLADFIRNKFLPDTYDYTKLFRLWEKNGIEIDLNMMRYIHGKEWDANAKQRNKKKSRYFPSIQHGQIL